MNNINIPNLNREQKNSSAIDRVFSSRQDFSRAVEKALEWSERGGPKIKSQHFVRAVIGKIDLNAEDFKECLQEIMIEIGRLKKADKEDVPQIKPEHTKLHVESRHDVNANKADEPENADRIIKDAGIFNVEELERSGGVDPNEI